MHVPMLGLRFIRNWLSFLNIHSTPLHTQKIYTDPGKIPNNHAIGSSNIIVALLYAIHLQLLIHIIYIPCIPMYSHVFPCWLDNFKLWMVLSSLEVAKLPVLNKDMELVALICGLESNPGIRTCKFTFAPAFLGDVVWNVRWFWEIGVLLRAQDSTLILGSWFVYVCIGYVFFFSIWSSYRSGIFM